MNNEKIYGIDTKSKKYIKLLKVNNHFLESLMIPAIIVGIIMLILAYVGDQILNIDTIFLIYLYILFCIYNIILKTKMYFKFAKIGNSYILKNNNEILIFYGDTSQEVLKSIDVNALFGIHLGQAVAGIDKTVGTGITGISALSALKSENANNKDEVKDKEIPNITIDDIINDPETPYDYYKNVRFIKKNKNYLYFNGDKNNYDGSIKNKNFKIDRKLYKNIDDILN